MLGLSRYHIHVLEAAECDFYDVFVQEQMLRFFIGEDHHERLYDCVAQLTLFPVDLLDFEVFVQSDYASEIHDEIRF